MGNKFETDWEQIYIAYKPLRSIGIIRVDCKQTHMFGRYDVASLSGRR